jgi:hypothetical protein
VNALLASPPKLGDVRLLAIDGPSGRASPPWPRR